MFFIAFSTIKCNPNKDLSIIKYLKCAYNYIPLLYLLTLFLFKIRLMKFLKSTLALLIVITIVNCKNNTNEAPAKNFQMQEVLAIHDEVMPKMGTIGSLIDQIDEKIKNSDSLDVLVKASQDLKDSHTGMMDWMKGFGERFDSDEILKGKALTAEKQGYLDEEEIKIKALRDQMNSSIQNAQELLK